MLGEREIRTARYYNVNRYACAIVAVITSGIDWAAYIGGCDSTLREEEAVKWVAKRGAKLSMEDAKHYFPDIKMPYRL